MTFNYILSPKTEISTFSNQLQNKSLKAVACDYMPIIP